MLMCRQNITSVRIDRKQLREFNVMKYVLENDFKKFCDIDNLELFGVTVAGKLLQKLDRLNTKKLLQKKVQK